MKETLIKIRNRILSWKVYLGRSASYVSLLNMGMIMFLTISRLKEVRLVTFDVGKYIVPLYLLTLGLLILFGYLDIKFLKGYGTETNILNKMTPLHPELAELKRKVDYLYEQANKPKDELYKP